MLKGRLGIETARIPYVDRHGLLWIDKGTLSIESGCLKFCTAGGALAPGNYQIPHQTISMILLGPGSSVTHEALRLLAFHGTTLVAIGEGGVRCYTAPPLATIGSSLARKQVNAWADPQKRIEIARKMYAQRLGEIFPYDSIATLRGIEGSRMKELYHQIAKKYNIPWNGRRYDRLHPEMTDEPNQSINHTVTAVEAAATIAVYATGTISQLGFIHEDASISFILDIADIFRDSFTIPIAFEAFNLFQKSGGTLDRTVRRLCAQKFHDQKLIPQMIDSIKGLFSCL